jgi:hypothetical protein
MKVSATRISSVVLLLPFLLSGSSPFFGARAQTGSELGKPPQYGQPKELCRLKDERIDESSGIAISRCRADAFWTNNDSGDSPRIFLFNRSGETIATVNISGASAVDWEDIASFKRGTECMVLIADTGDNARRRKGYNFYVIREPVMSAPSGKQEPVSISTEPELSLAFTYEDGPHDCESVAVDPTDQKVYLVTKEPNECKVYSMPIPAKGSEEPNIAKAIADLKIPFATSMDISPDGTRALILTYGDAYEFTRGSGETWAQAFSHEARILKMPVRKQGESVCYGADGKTLYLTSEGVAQPLWEVPVVEKAP